MEANDGTNRIDEIFADGRLIDEALHAAAADAVDRHRRARVPLVVFRDGRIEHVPADRLAPDPNILLADTDFAQRRSTKELVAWREERLSAITSCLAARPLALEHKGPFKQFIEELYPFVLWVGHLYPDREDVTCWLEGGANVDQPYDAIVEDRAASPPRVTYVQLTTTSYDRNEFLRMRELASKGIAPAYGSPYVLTCHTEGERREQVIVKIAQAVKNKSRHSYGPNYVLVVSFDDFMWFGTEDDRAALTAFVRERLPSWRLDVATLYIVGLSGRTFLTFPTPGR